MKGKGGGKSDSRECYNCGGKGHIARNCHHPKRESRIQTRAIEEADDEVCWGACMIDEIQDVHSATGGTLAVAKQQQKTQVNQPPKRNSNPAWRKTIDGGHRLKFVLDSGAVKTIIPKDAIPGMRIDRKEGHSFRVANGDVIPNLGSTKLEGFGTLNGSPMKIGTQVADITKPLASVDEMVANGMMVIMHRSGGIAKRLDIETERKIRDLVKGTQGSEVILERAGGSFTFEMDVKSGDRWQTPKKTTRPSTQKMQVDEVMIEKSYYDALWDDEYAEQSVPNLVDDNEEAMQCVPWGNSRFHWP